MTVNEKITALRAHMVAQQIAAIVIPSGDAHLSEYVCDHFRLRAYLSGFTGSAGTLVVGLEWAGLWTDGRYHTQAAAQLEGTPITLYPAGKAGVETLYQVLEAKVTAGQTIAVDGTTISKAQGDLLKDSAKKIGGKLRLDWACPASLWPDRPALPQGLVHPIDNAGQSAKEKLAQLWCDEKTYLITALDDIAWVLNLRGQDLAHTPVFLSYLWVAPKGATLFIQTGKLTPQAQGHLAELAVTVAPYEAVEGHCASHQGSKVVVDPNQINARLYQLLGHNVEEGTHGIGARKAIKTPSELEHLRNAHKKDAVAMVTFLHYLEENVGKIPLTEVTAGAIVDQLRSEQEGYLSPSFTTICGYNANGAIIHYEAKATTCATLEPHGLLLVDSGGQYTDGTTDITRTIPLGEMSDAMRRDYTLVLKGHLALANAVFPEGTTGAALDVLARTPLWAEGLDYLHGTGHGVGYRLSVHEGPQSIGYQRKDGPALEVGMVTSNEPGYYLPQSHGIRLENLMVCQKADHAGFLQFEPLTLVPFDKRAIDWSLMTEVECEWLNDYHNLVFREIAPLLSKELEQWLQKVTSLDI
ncbi:aminopeptidase P family protein [Bengtsoniella intestinalis]|uniref:aminopeptidase P family protein n=1 Tax=Bengtsoniella intestinalis TaxID=3073143 RepID=UPI00391F41AD